jgi:acyl-coenzyme A synthetase/AMP-(fatty) acid ligase
MRHVRAQLAAYKSPKQWRFAAELPRNATGKVLRRVVRDQWTA